VTAPGREIHLLRFVPGDSALHRMWAGTKVLMVVAIDIALVARPGWPAQAVGWAVALCAFAVSGVPATALPRPPPWFLLLIGVDCLLNIGSGGSPAVHLAGISIELGGLLEWFRVTSLYLLVFAVATLVAWTTPMAELTPAMSKLATPLRRLRLPVDEVVVAISLSVRCLPLLVEEFRVLQAARRMREPVLPQGLGGRVRYAHDVLVTALASSLRRAKEMAEAIEARGGGQGLTTPPVRLRAVDFAGLTVVATTVAAVAFLG
jgi:energy-coupling factor transporter transmembrane protein EcfT